MSADDERPEADPTTPQPLPAGVEGIVPAGRRRVRDLSGPVPIVRTDRSESAPGSGVERAVLVVAGAGDPGMWSMALAYCERLHYTLSAVIGDSNINAAVRLLCDGAADVAVLALPRLPELPPAPGSGARVEVACADRLPVGASQRRPVRLR